MTKCFVDETYFTTLTSETCYYLGFLHADAYLKQYGDKKRFSVHLSAIDKEWLKDFKNKIQSTHKLQEYLSNSGYPVVRLEICNPIFLQPLFDLKLKDPDILHRIPEKFKVDFIRGVFDGDGSLISRRRKVKGGSTECEILEWEICSVYPEFLANIQLQIQKELNIVPRKICRNSTIWDFRISARKDCEKIFSWLYSTDSILLPRKFTKFQAAITSYKLKSNLY